MERVSMEQELRSVAHDLRNLAYRLSILSENLEREMSPSTTREEARELLADTTERLNRIAETLRKISGVGTEAS
jgi:signal transduction histidine kinase